MSKDKYRYKVHNWDQYNKGLVRRGHISLWLDEHVIENWDAPVRKGRRGRPRTYSDTAIECMLALRVLYRLPLRAAEGLMASLLQLLGLRALSAPGYATLCRRQSDVDISPAIRDSRQPAHLLVDSTGLKVFGEGEWKMRKHGKEKRRKWRKVHLGVDAETREIVAAVTTESECGDCEVLPEILLQIHGNLRKVSADGAYDTWECRYEIDKKGPDANIPPRENAVYQCDVSSQAAAQRDQDLEYIDNHGKDAWKEETNYSQRSLVETAMFRVKRTFGANLQARELQNQAAEVVMKSKILNQFIYESLPESRIIGE